MHSRLFATVLDQRRNIHTVIDEPRRTKVNETEKETTPQPQPTVHTPGRPPPQQVGSDTDLACHDQGRPSVERILAPANATVPCCVDVEVVGGLVEQQGGFSASARATGARCFAPGQSGDGYVQLAEHALH